MIWTGTFSSGLKGSSFIVDEFTVCVEGFRVEGYIKAI